MNFMVHELRRGDGFHANCANRTSRRERATEALWWHRARHIVVDRRAWWAWTRGDALCHGGLGHSGAPRARLAESVAARPSAFRPCSRASRSAGDDRLQDRRIRCHSLPSRLGASAVAKSNAHAIRDDASRSARHPRSGEPYPVLSKSSIRVSIGQPARSSPPSELAFDYLAWITGRLAPPDLGTGQLSRLSRPP